MYHRYKNANFDEYKLEWGSTREINAYATAHIETTGPIQYKTVIFTKMNSY